VDSDWTLVDALAINNVGQITGFGVNPNGQSDAFLLTPLAVPEPTRAGLLALVGFNLLLLRRR
jgi:hypothetical protein